MGGWMDGLMSGWMDWWVDGWTDEWMDGLMGGWMDGWRDNGGSHWSSEMTLSVILLSCVTVRISTEHSPKLQIRSHSYLRAVSEVSINRSLDTLDPKTLLDPKSLLSSPQYRSRNESYMRAMSTISQVGCQHKGFDIVFDLIYILWIVFVWVLWMTFITCYPFRAWLDKKKISPKRKGSLFSCLELTIVIKSKIYIY